MAVTKFSDFTDDAIDRARQTVVSLAKETAPKNIVDLLYSEKLTDIEKGIKNLNGFSSKCWILSAILLYTAVYDKAMYQQSGLQWHEYAKKARERLGLDPRDITEQLSGARFFIKYHDRLMKYGWTPDVPNQSLARCELALELSRSLTDTIKHLVNDTQKGFRAWYQSFKALPVSPLQDLRPDIVIEKNRVVIGGIEAVTISDRIPPEQRVQIENYIGGIFQCLKGGDVPAIVPVYDENEARHLIVLRDNYRQGR